MKKAIRSFTLLSAVAMLFFTTVHLTVVKAKADHHLPCSTAVLHSADMFRCDASQGLAALEFTEPTTYEQAAEFFPQSWNQLGWDQRHNPVFPVTDDAPAFLQHGGFWAAPLTGLEFLRLREALDSFPADGGQTWAATVATTLSNIMGVSVTQGIVYAQISQNAIFALDAKSGNVVWKRELVNVAGMGQSIIQEVDGRLMVFVPVGDAGFTVQNAIDFSNGKPHDRGANFSGLYAFDGLTGEPLWHFNTKGASRPTPVLRHGRLHLATGGGEFFVLDAASGKQLGHFTNPGEGFPGLAAPNWYETADGRLLIIYGTLRPRRIIAVDATDPAAPKLAWAISPPGATANSPGDTSVAVDPERGLVLTTVFTSTATAGVFQLNVIALDANSGMIRWSDLSGAGPNIPGFKASVPMIHGDRVYLGNSLSQSYLAYHVETGERLWATDLRTPDDPADRRRRPGAAAVFYEGNLIHAEGDKIRTMDPDTGEILNEFKTRAENFAIWPITQPVIVGKQLYLGSLSGWVFAAPVEYLMTSPGVGTAPPDGLVLPPRMPDYFNADALPSHKQASQFPRTWLTYAGGQEHNAVLERGPGDIDWQTPLNNALPLDAPPRDAALYGPEIATHMTHLAFGVGSGVSVANGILYAGSDRYTINAINASTGELIWRHPTTNANFGQPLVTPETVVVGSGDPWMNLGGTGRFRSNSPSTAMGDRFQFMTGLDPWTGKEKWTVYSSTGTSGMTPLYHEGNLYWVNGRGQVWAVNADNGKPVAPFMDEAGLPTLSLSGFNVLSSPNIFYQSDGSALMLVGTAMPNKISAIDLTTAQVVWTQTLEGFNTYVTGFATVSPAVQQQDGLIISSVLVDADVTNNNATVLAFALDANSGNIVWTQAIGSGVIPTGFVGPIPMLHKGKAYFSNPLSSTVAALDVQSGLTQWQTQVDTPAGKFSWGPGVVVEDKLIQALGPDLIAFDIKKGRVRNRLPVGGAFTYNNPVVVGETLYIGNSWGWVTALPLEEVINNHK